MGSALPQAGEELQWRHYAVITSLPHGLRIAYAMRLSSNTLSAAQG